ncbi:MAG: ABC transporter ATP-binding protein [Chitinophagales bacterium]|nr:ABC transporter ATP-binding protein [Chitinophagales bacterium]MBP8753783.1 ABC transporter ATP-binding protein [Chitinophagales bacterium]MBP9703363.1 ABC transporter ATP-binding protein [Chitinophagales bacterium]
MQKEISNYILQLHEVAIGYPNKILHSNITAGFNKGEIIAVLGRNGSGKSTLLRCISGLQKQLEGEVILYDKNLLDYSRHELSRLISIVLSDNRKYAGMLTVMEIFELSRAPHTSWMHKIENKDREIIDEALSFFKITAFANRRLFTLSDGELQTIMIARAFVQDTDIIAFDEPTSHLDIFNQAEIFNHLKLLAKQFGKTIIIATHAIEQSLQIADTLLLLDNSNNHLIGKKEFIVSNGGIQQFFSSLDFEFDTNTMKFYQKEN